jgi:pantoate--beta-alanine ligase
MPPLVTDYLVLADPETFDEVGDDHTGHALLLVAAKIGGTRLIDNTVLSFDRAAAGQPSDATGQPNDATVGGPAVRDAAVGGTA